MSTLYLCPLTGAWLNKISPKTHASQSAHVLHEKIRVIWSIKSSEIFISNMAPHRGWHRHKGSLMNQYSNSLEKHLRLVPQYCVTSYGVVCSP